MSENFEELKKQLKKELDHNRYEHTIGVMYTAGCLAMAYGYDIDKAQLAGLLHDCAKCIPNDKKLKLCEKHSIPVSKVESENPFLLHAKLGAHVARDAYGITDVDILHAIKVHTTGEPDMNLLDKIIYIADYIEPLRDKARNLKEIRQLAFSDIDAALRMILTDSVAYLNDNKEAANIDPMTLETYYYYTGGRHE